MRRTRVRSRRRLLLVVVVGWSIIGAGAVAAQQETPPLAFGTHFHLPPSLEDDVRFWVDVFTRYQLDDAIVHDRENPAHVLAVVPVASGRSAEIDAVRRRYVKLAAALRAAAPRDRGRL
ncbi:hypothetical protein K2Z84_21650, partial [Candidatus Binatia bacterium]|nr:hypothetical protein [Candidatus Binatia bacterium]